MKKKRLIIFGVLALVVITLGISAIPNLRRQAEWKRTVTALQSLSHDRVQSAVQTFVRDRKTTDSTAPLRELLSGGYLRSEDVRGLEDRDVSVSVAADETSPQTVLIRVRASGGSEIALLADGSIQMVRR